MVDLALQVGLGRVVGSRQDMHGLAVLEHTAEHPPKSKEDLLVGVLRTWLAFLPAFRCCLGGLEVAIRYHCRGVSLAEGARLLQILRIRWNGDREERNWKKKV